MTVTERRSPHNSPAGPIPRLFLLTDSVRLPDPLAAIARLPAGSGVIFRHHDHPRRRALAAQVAQSCRQRHVVLLVANDWRLAAAIGADGVHLAEGLARHDCLAPCRLWLRQHGKMLSVAAHSPAALHRAQILGADFCLLSPVFASASHPGQPGLGVIRFAQWSRRTALPVLALGGMNRKSWKQLPQGTAQGWAAIDGLS